MYTPGLEIFYFLLVFRLFICYIILIIVTVNCYRYQLSFTLTRWLLQRITSTVGKINNLEL